MSKKSPMLAERNSCHLWPDKLCFPVYALPKLDGIRCWLPEGTAISRSLTPIANDYVHKVLDHPEFTGLDGELIVGSPTAENAYNVTCAVNGNSTPEPDFTFHVFDDVTEWDRTYYERLDRVRERVMKLSELFPVQLVEPTHIKNWNALEAFEAIQLDAGYEGVITRDPCGIYKFGRSTKREQGMIKLKRFTDSEAEVIGFEELFRNTNEDVRDALGHAKRSKAQAGLVAGGTLGKFHVRDLTTGVEFQIGMFKGLTLADKQEIWDNRDAYLGKVAKYQFFAHGVKDLPRHSKFLGWRDPADMS
jgi:DNA ligase-1